MASYIKHYTFQLVLSVIMIMTFPAVGVWLLTSGDSYLPARTGILTALIAMALTVAGIVWLVRVIRYPIRQTEMMARAIRNNDLMMHIPQTRDPMLRQVSADMNGILLSYRKDQNDLETRKNYYDRILRVMTHELRNTVTPIVSLTDLMVQDPDAQSEEERREAISIINGQAHNVCSFLESYRQLTVLAQPSMTLVPASGIFSDIKTLFKVEPGAERVRFEIAGNVVVRADSSLIHLALINIIRNAIQATDGVPDGKITVLASAPGGKPRITVTNNGPEIPENRIDEIFLPFYSTRKNGSGSGIGLALARQIMQLHDGTLTCSSHYPYTTFTLQFS